MASEYGYITVADLESYTSTDYSAIYSLYTDTVIEAKISFAEELVIMAEGTTRTGTIPHKTYIATCYAAGKLMQNQMIDDGYNDKNNPMTPMSVERLILDLGAMFAAQSDLYSDRRSIFIVKG